MKSVCQAKLAAGSLQRNAAGAGGLAGVAYVVAIETASYLGISMAGWLWLAGGGGWLAGGGGLAQKQKWRPEMAVYAWRLPSLSSTSI
jgi:alkylation response protein AidB-like acyl-CoA dehydrogenase